MVSDQSPDGAERETLLFAIRHRLQSGGSARLKPSEAALLLEWALECRDPEQQADLLNLFRLLGGLGMVQAALSDFG